MRENSIRRAVREGRAALGTGKLMSFVFNRPAIVLLLLAVPTAHALWSRPAGRLDRALAAVLSAIVIVLVFRSESEAAKLAVLVLVPCWALAALTPRVAFLAAALAFVLAMAIAPVLGPMAERLVFLRDSLWDRTFRVRRGRHQSGH